MMRRHSIGAAAAVMAASFFTVQLDAQSLTSVRGLGYPLLPVDARTEVLGGLGIGLKGLSVPLINPASAAGIVRRGAVVSVAAVEQTASLGDASDTYGATRFPLIQLIFPAGPGVITAGYGSYLDQSWSIVREGLQTEGETQVGYSDIITSSGGLGQLQIGAALPIGSRFAVGAAVGAYTGGQGVDFERRFDTEIGLLQPFRETWAWQYSAPLAKLGMRWDPLDFLRVAASVNWAGTLTGDSAAGPASRVEYQLPLQMAAGASAYLAPGLLANFSGRWSGWSSAEGVTAAGPLGQASSSRDTWELGGGLEWDNASERAVRSFPLRLGFQYRQLPFTFIDEAPVEWFTGAGIGMRLGSSIENPLARVDLAVQRGERTAAAAAEADAFTETAWRFSLTLSLFGN